MDLIALDDATVASLRTSVTSSIRPGHLELLTIGGGSVWVQPSESNKDFYYAVSAHARLIGFTDNDILVGDEMLGLLMVEVKDDAGKSSFPMLDLFVDAARDKIITNSNARDVLKAIMGDLYNDSMKWVGTCLADGGELSLATIKQGSLLSKHISSIESTTLRQYLIRRVKVCPQVRAFYTREIPSYCTPRNNTIDLAALRNDDLSVSLAQQVKELQNAKTIGVTAAETESWKDSVDNEISVLKKGVDTLKSRMEVKMGTVEDQDDFVPLGEDKSINVKRFREVENIVNDHERDIAYLQKRAKAHDFQFNNPAGTVAKLAEKQNITPNLYDTNMQKINPKKRKILDDK